MTNAVYDPKLWLQPSTPTPAMRDQFRDAARAVLNAEARPTPADIRAYMEADSWQKKAAETVNMPEELP